jgi:hypothetical protein
LLLFLHAQLRFGCFCLSKNTTTAKPKEKKGLGDRRSPRLLPETINDVLRKARLNNQTKLVPRIKAGIPLYCKSDAVHACSATLCFCLSKNMQQDALTFSHLCLPVQNISSHRFCKNRAKKIKNKLGRAATFNYV